MRLDDPVSLESDSLGRLSLAKGIYALVRDAPSDWTLRIGVYGAWGEGKTSLLNLLASLARADGMPVARFNPSLTSESSQLWNALFLSVTDALGSPRQPISVRLRARWHWRRLRALIGRQSRLGAFLKAAEPPHPVAGPLFRIAGLVSDGFRARVGMSSEQVAALLSTELANRRLVILIDDLDRTEPALLPRLLLAIRELDVSLTAFVVAIDPVVVTKGLETVHPGWKDSSEFLEKILQFHYWLTPAGPRDLLKLALEQIPDTGLDIPQDVVQGLLDDLPPNPRKLKEFFRSLWQLRPILNRHGTDEIDWTVLLLLERLRAEAPLVAAMLFRSETFLKNAAARAFFSKTEGNENSNLLQEIESEIGRAAEGQSVSTTTRSRILGIVKKLGDVPLTTAEKIGYWASIREDPPAVTRKEARTIRAAFTADPAVAKVWQLLQKQSEVSGTTISETIPALLTQLVAIRDGDLSVGIDYVDLAQIAASAAESGETLRLLEVLISDLHVFAEAKDGCSAQQLIMLYQHFAKWAEVEGAETRTLERDLLLIAGQDSGRFAVAVLDEFDFTSRHRTRSDAARELRAQLVKVLLSPVVSDLQRRFERQDGLSTVLGRSAHRTYEYLLLNPLGGLYTSEFITKLRELAGRAKREFAIQKNFIILLESMVSAYTWSNSPVTEENKPRLEAAKELLSVIWPGATATMVPPAIVRTLRDARESLLAFVGGDQRLPLPKWWSVVETSVADLAEPKGTFNVEDRQNDVDPGLGNESA